MIRPNGSNWLLLTQRDHAQLSADLALEMTLPPLDELGAREELLAAITHHDDGWAHWDAKPKPDPELGRPRGFSEMERQDSLPIWRASIESAAAYGPLAGATVAGHFLALSRFGGDDDLTAGWRRWAEGQRQAWLESWLATDPSRDQSAADAAQAWLRFFDAFSLNLCRGPESQPFPMKIPGGAEIIMGWSTDTEIHVEPWPFTKETLSLSLPGYAFPPTDPVATDVNWRLSPDIC